MTRYYVDPATRLAELAFTVRDDWPDRGIGTQLMRRVREVACAKGVGGLEAWAQADNLRMMECALGARNIPTVGGLGGRRRPSDGSGQGRPSRYRTLGGASAVAIRATRPGYFCAMQKTE